MAEPSYKRAQVSRAGDWSRHLRVDRPRSLPGRSTLPADADEPQRLPSPTHRPPPKPTLADTVCDRARRFWWWLYR